MSFASLFFLLALLAMLGVALVFLTGIFFMTRGHLEDHTRSNRMMYLRVGLQGAVILFLFLAYMAN